MYYCVCCGTFAFMIDLMLNDFIQRPLDNTYIIETLKHKCLKSLVRGPTVYLKRQNGIEKQDRLHCKGCGVYVGYTHSKYLYLLHDAFSRDTLDYKRTIVKRRGIKQNEKSNILEIDESGRLVVGIEDY